MVTTTLSNGQRIRRGLLFSIIISLPVMFNWFSPVLIIISAFMGTVNLSFIIFTGFFISSLFVGRLYCSSICPWGAVQEVLGHAIQKRLKDGKKRRFRKIKYVVFVAWVATIILAAITAGGYHSVDIGFPGGSLISIDGPEGYIFWFMILGLIILMVSIAGTRSFCNYACPMGVIGIIGTKIKNFFKWPSLHLEADASLCVGCRKCTKACVASLDVHEMVGRGKMANNDCIMCGACTSACSKNAIKYEWKWKKQPASEKDKVLDKEAMVH